MKYSIEEINEAWIEYNKSHYLVDRGGLIKDRNGEMIGYNNDPPKEIRIHKIDFICFLIDFSRKKHKK